MYCHCYMLASGQLLLACPRVVSQIDFMEEHILHDSCYGLFVNVTWAMWHWLFIHKYSLLKICFSCTQIMENQIENGLYFLCTTNRRSILKIIYILHDSHSKLARLENRAYIHICGQLGHTAQALGRIGQYTVNWGQYTSFLFVHKNVPTQKFDSYITQEYPNTNSIFILCGLTLTLYDQIKSISHILTIII